MRTRLVLLVVLCAGGCVRKDDGAIGAAESKNAGDSLAAGIEEGAASFGPVTTGATADEMCVTSGGNTDDPDGDSIPANAMLTFNCTAMAFGFTGMLTGTETVMDTQPSAVAWAFVANADLRASLTGPGGASIVRDVDGSITATQSSPVGPFALRRTLDAVTVFTGERGATLTEDIDWTVTFTPMATWTPGGVIVTGSINATGAWSFDVDGTLAEATLATPTALTLDPGCATRITAGKVVGNWGVGTDARTITVTWTACGVHTVVYSGGAVGTPDA